MEILGFIIIVFIWFFKSAVSNDEKKGGTKEPGKEEKYAESSGQSGWKLRTHVDTLNDSASIDGRMKTINRALDELDTKRAKQRGGGAFAADTRRRFENAGAKRRSPDGKRPSPVEIREFHEQRRADEWEKSEERRAVERANSEKRWAAARRQQADAALVHGVHIDSCEGRLESLRVLYEAGILDREEYAQRVARVRRAHAQQ